MKKMCLVILCQCLLGITFAQLVTHVSDPVEWINPLMGTDSKPSLSNGNTYPSVCVPWGMHYWVPQTGKNGDGWVYRYGADKIRGFKQTHQPSPWMNDYGQFSLMPQSSAKFQEDDRESWYSHKAETAKPYYYSVFLADAGVTTEITPTERAAQFRFSFTAGDSSFMVVDAYDKGSYIKILPAAHKVIGYSTKNSGGVPKNFRNYFVIYFDRAFTSARAWRDNTIINDSLEYEGNHAGAIVSFNTRPGEKVALKVASSFISFEQAELNLKKEIGQDNFETTKAKAKAAWNKQLNRLLVEGGSVDQVRTFYSCLYRTLQFPQKQYELDAANKVIHYSPYNGETLPGYMFAGTGFWDTFRALYPFLNLVYPSINKEMQAGLVNDYKEGGFLPEWSSPGYRNVMVGNNSASVVADAYVKGLRGYDINSLYAALQKDASMEGPIEAVGRDGVKYYNDLGYVPYDAKINESAARTLEYAYDDFTIYRLGKMLNRPKEELAMYANRSLNYKNLFDPEHKLMRGKNLDGSFQSPFNPFKWGDAFTEGNSWHYSWSVFHDIDGLITMMGGRKSFVGMLDSVFKLPPVFDESYYHGVIHEIREMQIMNMGQYAHGNQPIQHMIYLYNYAGEPWKTQYWVREVMNRLYRPGPDGYCGDEDNGQTSAWYVFSAMGFYPVCPATTQYVLGAPLFKKMTVMLENGKKLEIESPNNSDSNRYVQQLTINGQAYTKNWVDHMELIKGAKLAFSMSATPSKTRGTSTDAAPYSFSTDPEYKTLIKAKNNTANGEQSAPPIYKPAGFSGNPIFEGWYADPEIRIFKKAYWIYPTYSAKYEEQTQLDAFSSNDLVHWTKHPRVMDTAQVKWAKKAVWAPSAVEKNGRYFLFFGANDIQNDQQYGGIGIAVSDKPGGPFKDYLGKPLIDKFENGAQPIDQFVFKDKDGQYYLIYGGWRHCNVAKLNKDFTGFIPFDDGKLFREITPDGYVEGPFMFMRNSKYYFMWSEGGWTGPDYSVAYAVADSPFGPFTRVGKILQQDPAIATGAGHHSVLQVPGTDDWYIVYHRHYLGDKDGNHRVVCIDRMYFDEQGMIKPVKITKEGVRELKVSGQ